MIVRILLFAAVSVSAWSAGAAAPQFVAARFDTAARVVRFAAPIEVDWQAAARAHFSRFDFERLTEADLAYLRGKIWEISGDAEERFTFAPPPDVSAISYRLISAHGIAPLRVAALEGTIRFAFDGKDLPALTGTSFFGEAVSQVGADGGGFALVTAGAAPVERIAGAQASIVRKADGVRLTYRDGAKRASVVLPAKWHDKFDTAYGLRVGERRYLFVDWPPDSQGFELFCAQDFSLYEVGATLSEIARASYDCDV